MTYQMCQSLGRQIKHEIGKIKQITTNVEGPNVKKLIVFTLIGLFSQINPPDPLPNIDQDFIRNGISRVGHFLYGDEITALGAK